MARLEEWENFFYHDYGIEMCILKLKTIAVGTKTKIQFDDKTRLQFKVL